MDKQDYLAKECCGAKSTDVADNDIEARIDALDFALSWLHVRDDSHMHNAESVVSVAEVFYRYLLGEPGPTVTSGGFEIAQMGAPVRFG